MLCESLALIGQALPQVRSNIPASPLNGYAFALSGTSKIAVHIDGNVECPIVATRGLPGSTACV
jgi:hypothetical protein